MSIRFKFRSSVNFDTVEIENRASISVGELRAKILRGKFSQQQQQGFDLVFSDAVSGLEYKADDAQIPSGSSVIVKRVPGGTLPPPVLPIPAIKDVGKKDANVPIPAIKDVGKKDANVPIPANAAKDEFDEIGVDPYPIVDSNLPKFNIESDEDNIGGTGKDCIDELRLECQKFDSSDLSQAIPKGSNQSPKESNVLPRVDEQMNLNKLPTSNSVPMPTGFPLELKCPLCNSFFQEAVMIPCCQHSFCDKCIRNVLIEKGRCPKCFSSACNVKSLLPNLSLRQAIEHFLESEMLNDGLVNAVDKHIPDGESGIQGKDVSCAFTAFHRGRELPQASCATEKGSNQDFMEGFYDSQNRRNAPFGNFGNRDIKSRFPSNKVNQMHDMGGVRTYRSDVQKGPEDVALLTDFQGENQPVIPQANAQDEADSNANKKGGFWIDSAGADRNFSAFGGYRRGVRTCYTCGSPDHLMRECPMSNQNPMFQRGNGAAFHGGMAAYAPPYWNTSSFPPFRPYASMYGNHSMMPFNAPMVPVAPFGVPPYIPPMGGGMPGYGGNAILGNMGPPRAYDHAELQLDNQRKHSNDRELYSDNEDESPVLHRHGSSKGLHDYKFQKEKGPSPSLSGDSTGQRSARKSHHKKHMTSDAHRDEKQERSRGSSFAGRDKRPSQAERSNSGKDEFPRSPDRRNDERYNHHGDSKKYNERSRHFDSDRSLAHHSAQKDLKRRAEYDIHDSHKKQKSYPESDLRPCSPNERRGVYKERDTNHDSRHSRYGGKHLREKHHGDRRDIAVNASEDDHRDEYRYHKRRAH